MKKLLMGAIVLFLFSASICLVQISCKKADAQGIPVSHTSVRTILFSKPDYTVTGTDRTFKGFNLFISNIDGSNERQIPISLPSSDILGAGGYTACLTPNADSVIFQARSSTNDDNTISIYSCAIDGSGLKIVIPNTIRSYVLGTPTLFDIK